MQETISYILNLALVILPLVAVAWLAAWVIRMVFLHQTLTLASPFG